MGFKKATAVSCALSRKKPVLLSLQFPFLIVSRTKEAISE